MNLKDSKLLRNRAYIDGRWVEADGGDRFPVTNPANGARLMEVPDMGAAETRRAIEAAHAALPGWRELTAGERAAILRRWYELMLANEQDLAAIMTAEQGKPLAEALGEVRYGASFVEWFAEEGKRVYGDVIPSHGSDKR
ncbi:MAG: aldehyde dehydrogenase family protein, partial [Calditrichaeota bacterium]|nr:aldehyde dehydrogenase family protein [Calditrichota bacterium]